MGTGTEDLANRCIAQGLKKPEYQQEIDFRATLYRDYEEETAGQVTGQVEKILLILDNQSLSVKEMMQCLSLRGRDNFLTSYLQPALEQGFIEMKYSKNPNHPKQRYFLTEKGKAAMGK
jgi:ATP-dependent DNA helicase RecG